MPLQVTCSGCQRTLNVADRLAGQTGKCPGCGQTVHIPKLEPDLDLEDDGFEIIDDLPDDPPNNLPDESTYDTQDPNPIGDPIVSQAVTLAATPSPTAPPHPDARAPRPLASAHDPDENENKSFFKRPLLNLNGLDITPLRLLLTLVPLITLIAWWTLGPGAAAKILNTQTVYTVDALHTGDVQLPYSLGTGTGNRALGVKSPLKNTPGAATVTHRYSVGKTDQLIVTQPDPHGNHVLIQISLKQAVINAHGKTKGDDSTLRPDEFTLRKTSAPLASGTPARLIRESFTQPLAIDLNGASTSRTEAALPPQTPDDQLIERNRGHITATYEYAFGATRGKVIVNAQHAYNNTLGSTGLSAQGTLTTTHPKGGPVVQANYQSSQLQVSWNATAQGQWATSKWTFPSHLSPFTRHDFSLLFERPPHAGKYTLSYNGYDLTTLKLDRAKQPSAPAPSPIASNRPGGPQPASKTATGVGAYVDVLRDTKSRAQGLIAANNMRQLGIAFQLYRDQHKDRFPDTLADLRETMPQIDQLLANPRTGENPGYIYEKPKPGKPPAQTPILFESYQGQKDLGGAVLYGDGSIR